jgi:hypothetical protein
MASCAWRGDASGADRRSGCERRGDRRADARGGEEKALVCVFPELGLSAYSCEDLFHQQALLEGVEREFARLARADPERSAGRVRRRAGAARRAPLQLRGADLSRQGCSA